VKYTSNHFLANLRENLKSSQSAAVDGFCLLTSRKTRVLQSTPEYVLLPFYGLLAWLILQGFAFLDRWQPAGIFPPSLFHRVMPPSWWRSVKAPGKPTTL
jgi:hypothetical protein